ncbi:hypothetical protein MTO96_008916 [Rhipicephalus appendiculatus]
MSASPVSRAKHRTGQQTNAESKEGKANRASTGEDSGTNCSREGASARVYAAAAGHAAVCGPSKAEISGRERHSGPGSAPFLSGLDPFVLQLTQFDVNTVAAPTGSRH